MPFSEVILFNVAVDNCVLFPDALIHVLPPSIEYFQSPEYSESFKTIFPALFPSNEKLATTLTVVFS